MTDLESYELRQALDDLRLKWRDFEIDESKPSRFRASFFGYVVMPSALFGVLSGILAASMLTMTAIVLSYMTSKTARESFDVIIASGTAACTAVVMAYTALLLMDDWRRLQWDVKKRRYLGQPQREQPQRARYFERTSDTQIVGSRLDWDLRWKTKLARKCYDEYGRWVGGKTAVRDRHFADPNLYNNITGNWEAARRDLVRWGYIDNIEDCNWSEKAKGELLANLRIV